MIDIRGLAYVVAETTALAAWQTYAEDVLGAMTSVPTKLAPSSPCSAPSNITSWFCAATSQLSLVHAHAVTHNTLPQSMVDPSIAMHLSSAIEKPPPRQL